MTFSSPSRERLAAIGLMCASVTVFSILDTLAKHLANHAGLPVMEIIWVRFAGNVVLNLLMFGALSHVALMKSGKKSIHGLRSLLMALTTGFNFLALSYLQLDQTITLFFLAPLIIAALGGPLLGEWIGWRRMLAVLTGFIGVLFVTRPGFGGIHWAVLYSLGATITYAFYNISTRYLTRHDPASLIQVGTPLFGLALFLPPALWQWQWPGDLITWFALIALGFIGGFGHWLLVLAHRHAPAPIIAPFTYVGLPSMTLFGFLVFGDLPSWWTLFGAAIIIAAGGYLLWREN